MAVHGGSWAITRVGCFLCGSCCSDPGDVGAGEMLTAVRNNPSKLSSLLGIVLLSRRHAAILDATSGTSVM
jgi:hypothetical protein